MSIVAAGLIVSVGQQRSLGATRDARLYLCKEFETE